MAKKDEINVAKLMRQFDCEARDVYFSILISQGINKQEAYIAIFNPEDLNKSPLTLVNSHLRTNPQINSLITFLSTEKREQDFQSGIKNEELTKSDIKELVEQYKDKDFIISELIGSLKGLTGKDRADVLNRIADLQQMKKEETKAEEEKVHFYLPLPICNNCNRKKELLEKAKAK